MEQLTPRGTGKGPAETFTGDVYVDPIVAPAPPSRMVVAAVRFTPGARTHWHSHALGQALHCTDGLGFVATRDGTVLVLHPGETVWTPPGEQHWHGGTSGRLMCHLAMLQEPEEGPATTWLEPVSDEQYAAAHGQLDTATF
ncbi:MAG: cupin domain-containing protein [Dermatophilaceae bacterium]